MRRRDTARDLSQLFVAGGWYKCFESSVVPSDGDLTCDVPGIQTAATTSDLHLSNPHSYSHLRHEQQPFKCELKFAGKVSAGGALASF